MQSLKVCIPEAPVLADVLRKIAGTAREQGHEVNGGEFDSSGNFILPAGSDVLVMTPHLKPSAKAFDDVPDLRCVLMPTIGVDPLNVAKLTAQGVAIGHSVPEESIHSMAEAAVCLILALMTRLNEKQQVLRQGGWRESPLLGTMLRNRTVGVIGFGRIGQQLANLLRPFGVELLYHDTVEREDNGFGTAVSLDELLKRSDIVSLHAFHDGGAPLLGSAELRLMKAGSMLVNTARGKLVDEAALCDALERQHIAGAAIDVFQEEPLPQSSPLRTLANVILTPHNIGHTAELIAGLQREFVSNANEVFAGRAPITVFNQEVLPAWRARFGGAAGHGIS